MFSLNFLQTIKYKLPDIQFCSLGSNFSPHFYHASKQILKNSCHLYASVPFQKTSFMETYGILTIINVSIE